MWELLGYYTQDVSTQKIGTTLSVDTNSVGFGHEHKQFAVVVAQIKDISGNRRNAIQYLEYHEMPNGAIYDANITGTEYTNNVQHSSPDGTNQTRTEITIRAYSARVCRRRPPR